MRQILEQPIPVDTQFDLLLPVGAQLLSVVCPVGLGPLMYFEVPDTDDHELHHFFVFPSRPVIPFSSAVQCVGSFQTAPDKRPYFVYRAPVGEPDVQAAEAVGVTPS